MKTSKQIVDPNTYWEHPFECFKLSSDTIVQNWYKARRYVLDLINGTLDKSQNCPKSWHFIVDGDSELLLSVVRHLALYAHFCNYEEYDPYGNLSCANRTVITIVSKKAADEIEAELQKPEYLGNLPKYCPITIYGKAKNQASYIDIAIEVVKDAKDISTNPKDLPSITEETILEKLKLTDVKELDSINTFKALCADKAYRLGAEIDNIPYEDINSTDRYANALIAFQTKVTKLQSDEKIIQKEWESDFSAVRTGISNVFCADCFEIREKEVEYLAIKDKEKDKEKEPNPWKRHMQELSCCEHNRWVAEKLILGYEPLSTQEVFKYEHLFGDQRKAYWKQLKNDPISPKHIDICSNKDLRRIDPDNMKYDSFLMLAIQYILSYYK